MTCAELDQAWNTVKPTEATVEFGLSLTAKSGKLTGLVVEGDAAASLKVTMVWNSAACRRTGAPTAR